MNPVPTPASTSDSAPGLPIVLVVDDTPDNLALMNRLLRGLYRVKVANSGERALQIARGPDIPDLILLDVMMPEMNGYDVCRALKADVATRDIPVIFLTARSDIEDEEAGLALGAVDYIAKPISPPIVLARVKAHLALKASADFLRDQNAYLEREIQRRTRDAQAIQDVTIMAMASLAETRDNETGNHIRRTQFYVKLLAEKLQHHPRFSRLLTPATIDMLFKSAPLHDIGKVGIPDHILLKPGRLTPEEFEIMKTHTTLGLETIENAERQLGMTVDFLHYAKEIAYGHQEKWDGSGYPQGLKEEQIPPSARLMAVADVYDALVSRRVYKAPMSHEAARDIMVQGRGTHFDPDVLDAFLQLEAEFRAVADRYRDSDADMDAVRARVEAVQDHPLRQAPGTV